MYCKTIVKPSVFGLFDLKTWLIGVQCCIDMHWLLSVFSNTLLTGCYGPLAARRASRNDTLAVLNVIIAVFSDLDTRLEPAILDVTSRGIPFNRVGPFLFMKITSEQQKFRY